MDLIHYLDEIISFGILAACLVSGNARDRGLHRRKKTTHALVLGCVVYIHSRAFEILIWALIQPDMVLEYFHIRVGFFPPWLSLLDFCFELIVRLVALCLAYGLALRQPRARTLFVRLVPLFFLIDFWRILKEDMQSQLRSQEGISLASFSYDAIWSLLLAAFVNVALYCFYASDKTKRLIFGLETRGSRTSGTRRF